MWNGTMFVDLDWPLNASSLLSASAELLVSVTREALHSSTDSQRCVWHSCYRATLGNPFSGGAKYTG